MTRFEISVAVTALVVTTGGPLPAAATDPESQLQALGGIVVRYPASWQATSAEGGRIVVVAGPQGGGIRPVATILLAQGTGDPHALLDSAVSGLGAKAPLRFLGGRALGSSRWARYYVRGTGVASEYVIVGIAQGGGWIATMVAIDAASDPRLATHATVLQRILVDLAMP